LNVEHLSDLASKSDVAVKIVDQINQIVVCIIDFFKYYVSFNFIMNISYLPLLNKEFGSRMLEK